MDNPPFVDEFPSYKSAFSWGISQPRLITPKGVINPMVVAINNSSTAPPSMIEFHYLLHEIPMIFLFQL